MDYDELYKWKEICQSNDFNIILKQEKKVIKQGIKTRIEEENDTYKLLVPLKYEEIVKDIINADYVIEVVDIKASTYHAFDDLEMSVEDFLNKRENIRKKYEIKRWPMKISYTVLAFGSAIWLAFMIMR